jgi:hypothetical protein
MEAWIDRETAGCCFPDQRLGNRYRKMLESLSRKIGNTLPLACQDWAATKAAYRFLDNSRIDESAILGGHFDATRLRFSAIEGFTLVLHDTTEFSYQRNDPNTIGKKHKTFVGRTKDGRPSVRTVCGLLMHSSLVVTLEGLPLGLAAVKFWTRKKFKGTNALRGKVNATRMPIEKKESFRWVENMKQSTELLGDPGRCVHIGDRESDIFELFCAAQEEKTFFLVRTCADRLAEDGDVTVAQEMDKWPVRGVHCIEVRDKKGNTCQAKLQIRVGRMTILPPVGKQNRYPALKLTVIHAEEEGEPKGRERVQWKLLTNLPVEGMEGAVEKLQWYAMRWKIETFHKILKSGCKAEESKLRSASRLTNLLAIYCILAWRVFWLCMMNRTMPDAIASVALTKTECQVLDHLFQAPVGRKSMPISHYITNIARLGGYLARAHDSPPGNTVLWRGFARLTDIHLGFTLGKSCG